MSLALLPLIMMLLAFAILEARDLLSLVKGLTLLIIPLGLFLFLGFNFTYVSLSGTVITITKFFFFRNIVDLNQIRSLRYRAFGTITLDGIEVEYTTHRGGHRKAIFGSVAAYGPEQIAQIVIRIVQANPTVRLDKRVSSFLHADMTIKDQ
jgi:hypothetical protein